MHLEAITKLVDNTPFRPFRLTTSAGTTFSVPHREHIWLSEILIGVKNPDGTGAFLALDQIVSAEIEKPHRNKKVA